MFLIIESSFQLCWFFVCFIGYESEWVVRVSVLMGCFRTIFAVELKRDIWELSSPLANSIQQVKRLQTMRPIKRCSWIMQTLILNIWLCNRFQSWNPCCSLDFDVSCSCQFCWEEIVLCFYEFCSQFCLFPSWYVETYQVVEKLLFPQIFQLFFLLLFFNLSF